MIDLASLEDMFANMRADSGWNVDGPLLWGYFFTDRSAQKLQDLVPILEAQGYRFVDIFIPEGDDGHVDEEPYYFLHVEKVEIHSAQSLHEKNSQLYALAELHALDSYDGMDVGPVEAADERPAKLN